MTVNRFDNRSWMAVAVVTLALITGACGVRQDDRPRALAGDVPEALTEAAPSSTIARSGTRRQRVYVIEPRGANDVSLEAIPIGLEVPNEDAYPRQVIETLLETQPTDDETYINAIPTSTEVLDVRRVSSPTGTNDVLEIDLSELNVEQPRLKQAVGQFVFTAASISGINGVRFFINGQPTNVPIDGGDAGVGAIVTMADFAQLNSKGAVTTTTAAPTTTEVPPAEGN